eukprot:COSAG01_NODE_18586_length_1066_cov_0.722854_1_plen_272_part_10
MRLLAFTMGAAAAACWQQLLQPVHGARTGRQPAHGPPPPPPVASPASIDCAARLLALDFARPIVHPRALSAVATALHLPAACAQVDDKGQEKMQQQQQQQQRHQQQASSEGRQRDIIPTTRIWAPTQWVDPSAAPLQVFVAPNGNDGAAGTRAEPLRTLAAAAALARVMRTAATSPTALTVYLRGGTYHLNATLALGAADGGTTVASSVTWAGYPGEQVVISGGLSLPPLRWQPYAPGGKQAVVADVSGVHIRLQSGNVASRPAGDLRRASS